MLPMILSFQIGDDFFRQPAVVAVVMIVVAALFVSPFPTFAFKKIHITPIWVLPTMLLVALVAAGLVSAPWLTCSAALLIYLASFPFSYRSYQAQMRKAETAGAGSDEAPAAAATETPPEPPRAEAGPSTVATMSPTDTLPPTAFVAAMPPPEPPAEPKEAKPPAEPEQAKPPAEPKEAGPEQAEPSAPEPTEAKEPATAETAAVLEEAREMGVLVGKGGLNGNVLRIKPPMCITRDDVDFALEVLDRALSTVESA